MPPSYRTALAAIALCAALVDSTPSDADASAGTAADFAVDIPHQSWGDSATETSSASKGTLVASGDSDDIETPRPPPGQFTASSFSWELQSPVTSPSPVLDAAMVYDPDAGYMVLFG